MKAPGLRTRDLRIKSTLVIARIPRKLWHFSFFSVRNPYRILEVSKGRVALLSSGSKRSTTWPADLPPGGGKTNPAGMSIIKENGTSSGSTRRERPNRRKARRRSWNAPAAIEEKFRKLLGGQVPPALAATGDSVVQVLDDFITWCKQIRAARTAARYEDFCQDFVKSSEGGVKFGALPVTLLTSRHVTAWLNQRPTWGSTTKKNAITAVSRALNWAVKNRGLDRNPVRGMDKPEAKRRSSIVTAEEFETIMSKANGPFADLLTVSYDSGARPFEAKGLGAAPR